MNNHDARIVRPKKASAVAITIALVLIASAALLIGQVSPPQTDPNSEVFTPAHTSISEAARHFFGLRPEPVQPIQFAHSVHVNEVQLLCVDCHITVERGPRASIPDIRTCWGCHQFEAESHPETTKIKGFHDRGQDIPWQRVYGWNEEAHVRFSHAPHIREEIDCATCHGNVSEMMVAERVIDHTMGFCVDCHKQRQASIDCLTCHY
jgi:hypothetical protein